MFNNHFLLATNAQKFKNIPTDETGTRMAYQFNAQTGEMCASDDPEFGAVNCSLDPKRMVLQLTAAVREVEWRTTNHSNSEPKNRTRYVIDSCDTDDLSHSINGISNESSLQLADLRKVEFPVVHRHRGDKKNILVPSWSFTWKLEAEGQAYGAELECTLYFFNQYATIEYEGQRVNVYNNTPKITYEVRFI